MSIHYNSIIPSGGGSGSDPTKLPLTGGTLTGNLIVDAGAGSAGHYETTEMFVTRTDANTGAGESNAYGALYNGGVEIGDIAGNWAEFTTAHLRFGDGTIQSTAGLLLTGGTVTGATTFSGGVEFSGINGVQIYDSELFFAQQIRSYNGTTENELIIDSSQINLQNGATLSNLTKTQLRFEDGITDITIDATGIKFPNPYFNSGLFRGSFDSGRNSYNGISLVCTQGIELNWQAGYLKALNGSSVVPINVESNIALSNTTNVSADNLNISITGYDDVDNYNGTITLNWNSLSQVDDNFNSFYLNNLYVSGNNNGGSDYWGLGTGSVGAHKDTGDNYGLGSTGVGGNNHDAGTSFGLNSLSVGGSNGDDPAVTWEFGINGAKFSNGGTINNPDTQERPDIGWSGGVYDKEIVLTINGVTYAIPARDINA
jgi:hypothetical protein